MADVVVHQGPLGFSGDGEVQERYYVLHRDRLEHFLSFSEASSVSRPAGVLRLADVLAATLSEDAEELRVRVQGQQDIVLFSMAADDDLQHWARVLRQTLSSHAGQKRVGGSGINRGSLKVRMGATLSDATCRSMGRSSTQKTTGSSTPMANSRTGVLREQLEQSALAGLSLLEQNKALSDEVARLRQSGEGGRPAHRDSVRTVGSRVRASSAGSVLLTKVKSQKSGGRGNDVGLSADVQELLADLDQQLAARETEVKELAAEHARVLKAMAAMQEENVGLQQLLSNRRSEAPERRTQLMSNGVTRMKQVVHVRKEDDYKSQIATEVLREWELERERDEIKRSCADLEVQVIALKRKLAQEAQRLQGEQDTNGRLQQQIRTILQENASLRTSNSNAAKQLKRLATTATCATLAKRHVQHSLADEFMEMSDYDGDEKTDDEPEQVQKVVESSAAQTDADGAVAEVQSRLDQACDENATLRSSMDGLAGLNASLQAQVEHLLAQNCDLHGRLDLVLKQLSEAERQLKLALAAAPFHKISGIVKAHKAQQQNEQKQQVGARLQNAFKVEAGDTARGQLPPASVSTEVQSEVRTDGPPEGWRAPEHFASDLASGDRIMERLTNHCGRKPLYSGVLGVMIEGAFEIGYCAAYPGHTDCWARPSSVLQGQLPVLRIDADDILSVGFASGSMALKCERYGEMPIVHVFAQSVPELRGWYQAFLAQLHPSGAVAPARPSAAPAQANLAHAFGVGGIAGGGAARPRSAASGVESALLDKPTSDSLAPLAALKQRAEDRELPEQLRAPSPRRERNLMDERAVRKGVWKDVNTHPDGGQAARLLHGTPSDLFVTAQTPGAWHVHSGVTDKLTGCERMLTPSAVPTGDKIGGEHRALTPRSGAGVGNGLAGGRRGAGHVTGKVTDNDKAPLQRRKCESAQKITGPGTCGQGNAAHHPKMAGKITAPHR